MTSHDGCAKALCGLIGRGDPDGLGRAQSEILGHLSAFPDAGERTAAAGAVKRTIAAALDGAVLSPGQAAFRAATIEMLDRTDAALRPGPTSEPRGSASSGPQASM